MPTSWHLAGAVLAAGLALAGTGPALAGPAPAGQPVSTATEPDASATTTTTWALQPAGPDGPDGRVSLRHVVPGGAEVADLVAVTNFSDRAARFAVYASDGTISPDGTFDVLPPGEPSVAAGTWAGVGTVEGAVPRTGGGVVLEVPAGATVVVPVQIAVPDNATPGDHPLGIVAELVRDEAGTVQVASRVGVRVHLRVDGDVVASLVPQAVTASYRPSWNPFAAGTVVVALDVANTGNVRLGAETTATVSGPLGIASREATGTEHREVLPGQTAATTVEVGVLPFVFAWGQVETAPLVVGEDEVAAVLEAGSVTFTVWTVPWSQLALVTVVVGALDLVRALRRRNAARVQARIDAAVAAATAHQT